jgi:MFS family permease
MLTKLRKNILFSVYLLGFLFSIQVAMQNFINSSYLETLMPAVYVGFIYTIEAFIAIGGFLIMPRLLRKFGNFRLAVVLLFIEIISLIGLTMYHNIISSSFFMIASIATITFLSFSFDIFLEGLSFDASTGRTRGTYLTIVNLAWVLGPLLAGLVLVDGDYWKIYLSSFFLLIPVYIILRTTLYKFKDSHYQNSNPFSTILEVWKNKNIRNIFMSMFLLQIFYAWMTIYTPIYLHLNLGISWGAIGIIFGIMLIPFVFVQFPAGKLADSSLGEKEMLSVGFIIMALATVTMYFVTGNSIIVWSMILFGTRVGAALVEVMCDVYFFKKVDNENANIISFFRMSRPFAYIISPIIVTIILSTFGLEMKSLFLILGFLMFFGLRYSLAIKDTK